MALIKNINALYYEYYANVAGSADQEDYDFTGIFNLNSTNTALIEDEANQVLWIDGIPHDSISLVPKFDLPPKAFDDLKYNTLSYFQKNLFLTSKPSLSISHDDYSGGMYKNSDVNFSKYSSWETLGNLDLQSALNKGNYIKFTKNNEDYICYAYYEQTSSGLTDLNFGETVIVLVKTSNFSEKVESVKYKTIGFFAPLSFDVNNNSLICINFSVLYSNGRTYPSTYFNILKYSFSPLQFVSSTSLIELANSSYRGSIDPLSTTAFWAGYDSNDNNVLISFHNAATFKMQAANIDFTGANPALTTPEQVTLTWDPVDGEVAATKTLNPVPAPFMQCSDPALPNTFISYVPGFDSSGNFAPVKIVWDKSQDLSQTQSPFTLDGITNADITYSSGVSSDYFYSDTFNLIASQINSYLGNTTSCVRCFITKQDNNYYLNVVNVFKRKQAFSTMISQPASLNMVTFSIEDLLSTSESSNLTYHSHIKLDCMDMVVEDLNGEEIVVISPDSIKVCRFLGNSGWVVSTETPGIFTNYTKDSFGRRWSTSQPLSSYINEYTPIKSLNAGRLLLIDPQIKLNLIDDALPHQTSIRFSTPAQTYSGNNLSNTLLVNAYDSDGNRLESYVILTIEGNNMTFDENSSTQLIIQTSTIQDTSVPVTITGPGHVSVSASFNLA